MELSLRTIKFEGTVGEAAVVAHGILYCHCGAPRDVRSPECRNCFCRNPWMNTNVDRHMLRAFIREARLVMEPRPCHPRPLDEWFNGGYEPPAAEPNERRIILFFFFFIV